MNRLIVALDTADLTAIQHFSSTLAEHAGAFKIGLEAFLSLGSEGYRAARHHGHPIMLDLKLHDIPNTVVGAVRAVLPLRPWAITVHTSGGAEMIRAARETVVYSGHRLPLILAVTVLTSLQNYEEEANDLAYTAIEARADGVVCNPLVAAGVRKVIGTKHIIVTPGIRLNPTKDDQVSTATPRAAIANGADYIVVGRPITRSADPGKAAAEILREMNES